MMKRFTAVALMAIVAILAGGAAWAQGVDCTGFPRKLGVVPLGGVYDGVGFYYNEQAILVDGPNLIWRITSTGVTGFDVSNPVKPTQISYFPVSGYPGGSAAIVGKTLALPLIDNSGIVLVDVTDKLAPKYLNTLQWSAYCFDAECNDVQGKIVGLDDVATDGTNLYVGYRAVISYPEQLSWVGVMKFDLSNPANPKLTGDSRTTPTDFNAALPFADLSYAIAYGNGHVYQMYSLFTAYVGNPATDIAGEFRVRAIDTATMTATETMLGGTTYVASPTYTFGDGMKVVNGKLYFFDWGKSMLQVYDLANPKVPARCGQRSVASGMSKIVAGSSKLFGVSKDTALNLLTVDISNACSPGAATKASDSLNSGVAVIEKDSKVYVFSTTDTSVIEAYDATGTTTTQIGVSSSNVKRSWLRYNAISPNENFAYVAALDKSDGILVFNITDKLHPVALPNIPLGHNARAVQVSGNTLVVVGETSSTAAAGKFTVFDITNPGAPVKLVEKGLNGGAESPQDAQFGSIDGKLYMFLSAAAGQCQIWDMSNPAAPVYKGKTSAGTAQIYASNFDETTKKLYLAAAAGGVWVFDVTNPAAPVKLKDKVIKDADGNTMEADYVAVKGTGIYVATFDDPGLIVLDSATLEAKVWVDGYQFARTLAVTADKSRLIVGTLGKVGLFDLTDPLNPVETDVIPSFSLVRHAVQIGNTLAMAAQGIFAVADLSSCLVPDFTVVADGLGATATDASTGEVAGRLFNFGDGFYSSASPAAHTFAAPGTYLVEMGVYGQNGWAGTLVGTRITVPAGPACTPTVEITSPAEGAAFDAGATITATTTVGGGFVLDCPTGGANVACHGHWHAYVDGALVGDECDGDISFPASFAAGTHTFKVALCANDHTPLSPAVEATRTFVVNPVVVCTPTLAITGPLPGQQFRVGDTVTVAASIAGFTLDCPADGTVANMACHGHWAIEVDDALDGYSCAGSHQIAMVLAEGTHRIKVSLRNNDHSAMVPPIEQTVSITVAAAPVDNWIPRYAVPGQARATGSDGAFFRTSFWATNVGAAPSFVRLRYYPRVGSGNGGALEMKEHMIAVGESMSFRDVLSEDFGATADTAGTIVVEVKEGTPTPLVTSRTYNDDPAKGTYGQFIPGVFFAGVGGTQKLHGLGGDADNRTNVGIVNLSSTTLNASVSVYDKMGVMKGTTKNVTVPVNGSVQINRVNTDSEINAGDMDVFSAKVVADGAFFVYASKLDNPTSDPIFIPGTLSGATKQWIDGVASAAGQNNTYFKSNLSLTNYGTVPANVTVTFTKRGETAAAAAPATISLAAGETKYWNDAVKELTSLEGVAGIFAITSDQPVVAWARTYNDNTVAGGTGAYGQFIPAFATSELIGVKGAIFQGLSQSANLTSGFRTNMGFVNAGTSAVDVSVEVHRKDGFKAGQKSYNILAGQAIFKSSIIDDILGAGSGIEDGYIVVLPPAGSNVYGWASSVDNRSSDPTFVRPLGIPLLP
jgi:hypothetical protein